MNITPGRSALTLFILLAALLARVALAAQAPPRTSDFAHGVTIETSAPGPLHELPLPLDVYRLAARPDLGDLRVFNAAGEVAPHGLLPGPLQAPQEARRVKLAAFPFRLGAPLASSGLEVRIDQRKERTRVIVRGATPSPRLNDAWLVDAGELHETPRALLLSWPPSAAPFTRRVRLEGSDDLTRWYRLGEPLTIADVTWAGEHLRIDRVDVPAGRRHAWYRLAADDAAGALPTLEFAAELAPAAQGRGALQWLGVMPEAGDETTGELRFSTPAALPVEWLRIVPGERNTYLRLRVQARGRDEKTWRDAGGGSVYRLDFDNAPLLGAPLRVRAPGATEWRLLPSPRAASTGTGFGSTLPRIEVGWTPRSLVFLARGEGPYTLAFGSRRVAPVLTDGRRLLGDDIAIVGLPLAGSGATRPLGDATRALSETRDIDWKQLALWAVLVAGALLLTLLAWRVLRSAAKPPAT